MVSLRLGSILGVTMLCSTFKDVDAFVPFRRTADARCSDKNGIQPKNGIQLKHGRKTCLNNLQSNEQSWKQSIDNKALVQQRKKVAPVQAQRDDYVRDISDFNHPQQRGKSPGRRPSSSAQELQNQLNQIPRDDMVRDISDLRHKQQVANAVGRRSRDPTTSGERSAPSPPQGGAPPGIPRPTSSEGRQASPPPKEQAPPVSAASNSARGGPSQAENTQPPPPPRQDLSVGGQQRIRAPPNSYQHLVFDEMSPLEIFERQRRESYSRTQRRMDRPGYGSDAVIDIGHYEDDYIDPSRLVFDEDDHNMDARYPQGNDEDPYYGARPTYGKKFDLHDDEPSPPPPEEEEEEEETLERTSSVESEDIRQLKEEMAAMKEQRESLLQNLFQVQEHLDRAVTMVSMSDDKDKPPVNVPSSFLESLLQVQVRLNRAVRKVKNDAKPTVTVPSAFYFNNEIKGENISVGEERPQRSPKRKRSKDSEAVSESSKAQEEFIFP